MNADIDSIKTESNDTKIEGPITVDAWISLIEEGNDHFANNRTVKAEQSFIKGLELSRELLKEAESDESSSKADEADKDGLKTPLDRAKNRVAKSANNLAALYHAQGKFKFSEPLYEKSLDIKIDIYGLEHLETALNLHNLAIMHSARRKYEKAEILYQRTLEVREAILGAEHKDLVPVLNNYALMLEKMGRSEEAVSIRERAQKLDSTN